MGRRNQQLEGVCHLLEYGYQHQQFCKMPCFCIPAQLNESSPPFSLYFECMLLYSLETCFLKDVYMINQNYSCCLHQVFINHQSMIEKYILLTMQMSSVSFTYTIFMLWTGFCYSIISIARSVHFLPYGQALHYFSRATP